MKVLILAAIVAVAAAQYKADYKPDYKYESRPHNYDWAVKDDASYNDFAQGQETDASGNTKGSYRVLLPDGRVQTVGYTVNAYDGYVADVQYSGEPKYDYKPAYKAPAYPAYKN